MHILITGGTGFIGSKLAEHFLAQKHKVTILSRKNKIILPGTNIITNLEDIKSKIDLVINLTGEPLDKNRWNDKVKNEIYNSRINTTKTLIDYINNSKIPPSLLISFSAIGYYGSDYTKTYIEKDSSPQNNFSSKLCFDWEKEAYKVNNETRICIARLGIVLGKNGGALSKMLLPFKLCLGARLGNGKQYMSWIHIDDVIGAIDFLIKSKNSNGPYNFTSPNPVSNSEFTKILSRSLSRISFLYLPEFLLKLLFGEMGKELFLKSQKIYPEKLINEGYRFKYNMLESALQNIVTK
jgi:uncharacterized protein (TIGR01777 family)